jgi:hypothetical protein
MKRNLMLVGLGMAAAAGMGGGAYGAHVHLYADAAGGQLVFTPSSGSFSGGRFSDTFSATGVSDAYLPGIAVSFPTVSTLENFDGEQSFHIQNHDVGVKVVGMSVVSGSPEATFSWLITQQDREFAGQNTGNPTDQLLTASVGSGGFASTGLLDLGPVSGGVPTGNHWHGQHLAFSAAGTYDVTFQLVDLNGADGLAGTYGTLGDSPLYTVRFAAVPEAGTLGLVGAGLAALGVRRRSR